MLEIHLNHLNFKEKEEEKKELYEGGEEEK